MSRSTPHSPHSKPLPVRYEFFTTVAITIYEAAIANGASKKGAVLVISQASLESGFAQSAIQHGDYNLFGQMTLGSDYKRKTAHGKVKDFSQAGGYAGSMAYYFSHISAHKWTGMELVKKENFTAQDIDDAFNTGTDYPTEKERYGGKYAYNSDMGSDKRNHYGEHLYTQMRTTKTRMVAALEYKVDLNNASIRALDAPRPPESTSQPDTFKPNGYRTQQVNTVKNHSPLPQPRATAQLPVNPQPGRQKPELQNENGKLQIIIAAIRTVPL